MLMNSWFNEHDAYTKALHIDLLVSCEFFSPKGLERIEAPSLCFQHPICSRKTLAVRQRGARLEPGRSYVAAAV